VNYHLAKRGLKVERLEKDFKDGVLLITLLETLTGTKFLIIFRVLICSSGKELAKSTLWSRKLLDHEIGKLDTLTVAFKFMEGIHLHLTNCGPEGMSLS